jgi:hypothetical protein
MTTDWTHGKEIIGKIIEHLTADGVVIISTYCKAWQYDKRHVDFFKVGSDGHPLVRQGKHWNDFSGNSVKFYTYKKVENDNPS